MQILKKSRMITGRYIRKWLLHISLLILLLFLCSFSLCFTVVRISGRSMSPTINDNSTAVVIKYSAVKQGDIILIKMGGQYIVKRVIGLEGDAVEIRYDSLYVNDVLFDTLQNSLDELYNKIVIIPPGTLFALGDNRLESNDSREFGCVSLQDVRGVVIFWR